MILDRIVRLVEDAPARAIEQHQPKATPPNSAGELLTALDEARTISLAKAFGNQDTWTVFVGGEPFGDITTDLRAFDVSDTLRQPAIRRSLAREELNYGLFSKAEQFLGGAFLTESHASLLTHNIKPYAMLLLPSLSVRIPGVGTDLVEIRENGKKVGVLKKRDGRRLKGTIVRSNGEGCWAIGTGPTMVGTFEILLERVGGGQVGGILALWAAFFCVANLKAQE